MRGTRVTCTSDSCSELDVLFGLVFVVAVVFPFCAKSSSFSHSPWRLID